MSRGNLKPNTNTPNCSITFTKTKTPSNTTVTASRKKREARSPSKQVQQVTVGTNKDTPHSLDLKTLEGIQTTKYTLEQSQRP